MDFFADYWWIIFLLLFVLPTMQVVDESRTQDPKNSVENKD
jgi:hypothetical protein